jgi:hypothetical protein
MNYITALSLLVAPLLQLWLAILLVRKRVARDFRFFFVYTAFAVVAEIVKFLFRGDPLTYFQVYLVTEPLYALLGYLAISDVFYQVFQNFHRIWWFKLLLPGMGLLMLGLAVIIATLRPPLQASEFLATVFVLQIIVRCLQLGVFFLIFGLARFYYLFWRQYSFGIAAGFGVAAFGILVTFVARSIFGTKYAPALQFLPSVTYLLAVLIWLVSFLKPLPPDPLREVRPMLTPDLMRELYERYRRLLRDLFNPCSEAS